MAQGIDADELQVPMRGTCVPFVNGDAYSVNGIARAISPKNDVIGGKSAGYFSNYFPPITYYRDETDDGAYRCII